MVDLSVLVISHNQAHLIGRCLDSILSQKLSVTYEIIISDDASTDSTWDVILEYKNRYPDIIKPYKINSSEYNPDITSDRCAINKANVYSRASGRYVVNIDADDYLCIDTIYQDQIDLLESHQECSICLQNIVMQNDGDCNNFTRLWFPVGFLNKEDVINQKTFFEKGLIISNPAVMMRRDMTLDPYEKYGLLFDDFVITLHHLTFGKAICIDKAGYVYVQYQNSIWNTVIKSSYSYLRSMAALNILLYFFPQFRYDILYNNIIVYIQSLKALLLKNEIITIEEGNKKFISRLNSKLLNLLINNTLLKKQNLIIRLYLFIFVFASKINLRLFTKFLYYLIK